MGLELESGAIDWKRRSVLVTGATGFLGGHLTKALLQLGASVVSVVRDLNGSRMTDLRISIVMGDVTDTDLIDRALAEYEIETVFHLAAQAIVPVANRNPRSTFETNIGGTWAVLEACRRNSLVRQIVVASSDKAYGTSHEAYTEDMPLAGVHPYDVSKSCADLIASSYAQSFGLPVAITRCGNLFGGGDSNPSRLIPMTIRAILDRVPLRLRTDGSPQRDYFYVEDAAEAYILLAEKLGEMPGRFTGKAFNFSYEKPMSVNEIVNVIANRMNYALDTRVIGKGRGEIPVQGLSALAARIDLGWHPSIGFDEGIDRTIAWYKEHP